MAVIMFISGSITESRIAPTIRDVITTNAGSILATRPRTASLASSESRRAICSIAASPEPARIPSTSILQDAAGKAWDSFSASARVFPSSSSCLQCSQRLTAFGTSASSAAANEKHSSSGMPLAIAIASASANRALLILRDTPRSPNST